MAFILATLQLFQIYIKISKNKIIFNLLRYILYYNWLINPNAKISKLLSKKEQAYLITKKYRALKGF